MLAVASRKFADSRRWLERHMNAMVPALLGALVVALFVTPSVIRIAGTLGLYDPPGDARHIHKRPVPRLGGIAIFVATVIGIIIAEWLHPSSAAQQRFFLAILLGGGSVFIAGLVDDLRGLPALPKLAVECAAALIVCLLGLEIDVIGLGPVGILDTGQLAVPLTVLWIVGVTNAFNLVDGLDGLATGIALVALGTMLTTSVVIGNNTVAIGSVALLGALLGFGRFNLPPAKIFLGDSGSLFVGFVLAVLSVQASIKSTTVVLMAVPLCAVAIPLIDMSLAIVRRWLRGSPIFDADARHLHHRLLALGLRPERAAGVLVLGAGAFALIGLTIAFAPQIVQPRIGLIGGIGAFVLVMSGVRKLKYHEFDEAAAAVADVFHTRHAVHERIRAREAANRILNARSLRGVEDALQDSANALRYARMEFVAVDRRTDAVAYSNGRIGQRLPHVWVLEYPVAVDSRGRATHVLCIVGDTRRPPHAFGVERIAWVIVPALATWLLAHSSATLMDTEVPVPFAADHVAGVRETVARADDRVIADTRRFAATTHRPAPE